MVLALRCSKGQPFLINKALKKNLIIISRILVNHMDYFKITFENLIEWHIKHKFHTEMSSKSVVVSFLY